MQVCSYKTIIKITSQFEYVSAFFILWTQQQEQRRREAFASSLDSTKKGQCWLSAIWIFWQWLIVYRGSPFLFFAFFFFKKHVQNLHTHTRNIHKVYKKSCMKPLHKSSSLSLLSCSIQHNIRSPLMWLIPCFQEVRTTIHTRFLSISLFITGTIASLVPFSDPNNS